MPVRGLPVERAISKRSMGILPMSLTGVPPVQMRQNSPRRATHGRDARATGFEIVTKVNEVGRWTFAVSDRTRRRPPNRRDRSLSICCVSQCGGPQEENFGQEKQRAGIINMWFNSHLHFRKSKKGCDKARQTYPNRPQTCPNRARIVSRSFPNVSESALRLGP